MPYYEYAFQKDCHGVDTTPELAYFTLSISLLLMALIIPGNLLQILAVVLDPCKNLRTPFNFMMTNLAAADLIVGTVTGPMSIYIHWKKGMGEHVSRGESHLFSVSYFISCTASMLSLATLAVERYLAIRYPYTYRNQLTRRRVVFIAAGIWILSIAISCIYFEVGYVTYAFIFANTSIAITATVICFMYYLTYRAMKMRARSGAVQKRSQEQNGRHTKQDQNNFTENCNSEQKYHCQNDIVGHLRTSPEISHYNSTVCKNGASNDQYLNKCAENLRIVPENHVEEHDNITILSIEVSPSEQTAAKNITSENHHQQSPDKMEHHITKCFLVVLLAILLFYVPSTILIYAMSFCHSCSCTTLDWLNDSQLVLLIANSSVNFFVYAMRSVRFRTAFVKILKLKTSDKSSLARIANSSTGITNL